MILAAAAALSACGGDPPDTERANRLRAELLGNSLDCRGNCSTFEDGYVWAETEGIVVAEDCQGHREPFDRGCTAYVREGDELDTGRDRSDDDAPERRF